MKPSNFSEPVQLIAFVLQRGGEWDPTVLSKLEGEWGPIRYKGKLFAFDKTSYYEPEMGAGLYRGVLSFEKCIPAESIALEKARSNALEMAMAAEGDCRQVNIDIGYMDLDKVVQGMRDAEMIVLAARPSMGKTSLAMNICTSVALDVDCNGKKRPAADRSQAPGTNRLPVAIFSCEMSTDALITRLLCTLSGVPFTNIVDKTYVKASEVPKMHARITKAAADLMGAPIYIDDTGGLDIMDVRARARRLKKQHGIRLVMIDYLQLLNSREGSDEGRQQETTKISAGIKAMAKELNVPVIVLSQLSRAPEQRDKAAKPRLSDLRDSGSIEQDADVVLLLRRPCKYPGSPDSDQPNLAVVDVAKNRNGATGEVNLNFDGNVTRFSDYAYAVDRENPAAL